ncbi:MAG TPA: sugar ABC transporter ATP-binding protein [Acetobacteraceae bacterium]|nr:sugar ABC transporter ATP-binding protein [Acetobacteraceae bacterium]
MSGPGAYPTGPGDVVEVRKVSKSFGETHALSACSFSARAGEVHAVVGENGSGKSTLAKLLAGVLHPDRGSVRVDGVRPANPAFARAVGIAVVFQEILVAEGASVLENLFISDDGLLRARLSQREKRKRANSLLGRLLGGPIDLDMPVEALPLNTRQWIVIARALLGNPRVAVFDESTAALDHASVERFFAVVRELKESGAAVLVVTHRIHELTAICDRATVLSDGVDVGTLAGAEIKEERLLELMRGETVSRTTHAVGPEPRERRARAHAGPALTVSGLRLAPEAAAVELVVRRGEIVGLAGLEGHGQGEFLQAVTGIRRPAAGEVRLAREGRAAGRTPGGTPGRTDLIGSLRSAVRAGMAYIPGDRKAEGVFANLSVFENFGIACYRRTARAGFIDGRRVGRMFADQVETLAIRIGRATAPINSLSGGNQQKIVLARALAAAPLVLALNDPTRGVDIGAKRDLYVQLQGLAEAGKAILFLSNEIEEFVGLCDRVAVFRSGSIFVTLAGAEITADAVLAAMFGYRNRQDSDGAPH